MVGTFRVVHDGVQVGWLVVESRAAMVFYGDPPDLWWGRAGRTCLYWEGDEELEEWVSGRSPDFSAGFPVGSEVEWSAK
jgi:hypothetical protein